MDSISKTLAGIDIDKILEIIRKVLETLRELFAKLNISIFPDETSAKA